MKTLSDKTNMILFILLGTFWGGSFIAIKYMVDVWPPFFSAGLRVGLSWLALTLCFVISRKSLSVPFSLRYRIWIAGLFSQGIPFTLLFWGEQHVSPGLSGILNGTTPLWTFLLGFIFLRHEKNGTPLKIIGLILGIAGVIIIFSPLATFNGTQMDLLGTLAVLGMAISYSIASILTQFLFNEKNKVDFCANLYHQHAASFVYLLLMFLLFEKMPAAHSLWSDHAAIISMLYLGLISTALAWFFYYHLIRVWGAVRTSTVCYLIPVSALLGDFIFRHTLPTYTEIIGVFVVMLGVMLIQIKRSPSPSHL